MLKPIYDALTSVVRKWCIDRRFKLQLIANQVSIKNFEGLLSPYLHRGRRSVPTPRNVEHRLLDRKRFLQRQLVSLEAEEQDRRTGDVTGSYHIFGRNPRPVGDGAYIPVRRRMRDLYRLYYRL